MFTRLEKRTKQRGFRLKEVIAKVEKVKLLNANVYEINLHVDAVTFIAGQYLMIQLPTGESVPYSIGSAPYELPKITLYILVTDENSLANQVVQHLQNNGQVTIKMPGGDCHSESPTFADHSKELVLIAGGTGFAQMKSMYEDFIKREPSKKISFYWGVRTPADLFLQEWAQDKVNVHIVVNEASDSWQGATGWLYEKIIVDHNLENTVACLSGSPAMVYGTLDQLEEAGLDKKASCSDVFAYAPRP